jgi:uncharacterized protein YjbI with pentapeptide repeats
MVGCLWRGMSHGLVRLRWLLAGLAALVVILACVLVIPQWLVRWELGAQASTLAAADRAKAINDVRVTLLQGIGGAVILLGAYFTYRQLQTGREELQIAQQGQVTERFTRAIDQLGHPELDVRLGGIYALERIANDSPDDRATIAEVLTAFVRGHAPWPPRLPGQYRSDAPIEQVPELQVRAPDVQAALTVIARRQAPPQPNAGIDLRATDLRKARLNGANLQGAHLGYANLQEANLHGAKLQRALLHYTQLQGAGLERAQLQGAFLVHAQLEGARLGGAELREARANYANLHGAQLFSVQFQSASLWGANLEDALLLGANLQGVDLTFANLRGAILVAVQLQGAKLGGAQLSDACLNRAQLEGASIDGARLNNAFADPETAWPAGFDPRRAGVVLTASHANAGEGRMASCACTICSET